MSGANSAYSPLPQSNSDSDGSSEEELQILQEDRIVKRISKTQNSTIDKIYNGKKSNVINYKPLDTGTDIAVNLIKFQSNSDEVSILKPNSTEIFSTSRKICFVMSLLLCVFTTVVFIWALPCDGSLCAPPPFSNYTLDWEKTFQELELFGPINNAHHKSKIISNIILLTRSLPKSVYGLLSLKANDGRTNWMLGLEKEPLDLDCNIIDVNNDGNEDCLLLGNDYLKALDSSSGEELWDIRKSSPDITFKSIEFPLVVVDVDQDKTKELLAAAVLQQKNENSDVTNYRIIIISGTTGTVISNPLQGNGCSSVRNLLFFNASTVSYTCYKAETESVQTIRLLDILKSLKSYISGIYLPTEKSDILVRNWNVNQHRKKENELWFNMHRIIVENQGKCPEDCMVTIVVQNERFISNNVTVFSKHYKNSYGMAPARIRHNKIGFVIKLWKWYPRKDSIVPQTKDEISDQESFATDYRLRKRNNFIDNLPNLDKEMYMESMGDVRRFKRTSDDSSQSSKSENSSVVNLRIIRETIIGLYFNGSEIVPCNISEEDIIQVCRSNESCEPNSKDQIYSLTVGPIIENDYEKIITFSSSYIYNAENQKSSDSWELQSKVRVMNP